MTDLEICKRIAEIEGVQHQFEMEGTPNCYVYSEQLNKEYNPLTDKELCFDLMVKYDVRVEPVDCNAWLDNEDSYPEYEVIHHEGTLQEAICLVIIEAHKNG